MAKKPLLQRSATAGAVAKVLDELPKLVSKELKKLLK